jgi:hypothetical protein
MKKSIHIAFLKETHAGFKIKSFEYGLSMTEMIEEFARQVIQKDPHLDKILKNLVEAKKNREIRKFSKTDADSIFNLIDEESPF